MVAFVYRSIAVQTPETTPKKSRKRLIVGFIGLMILFAWGGYRLSHQRFPPSPMITGNPCETDPIAVADMSPFSPEAAPIRCEMWDIGTGVTGYVWHAPNPRAIVLFQHGYSEYAYRYIAEYSQLIPHLLNQGITVYAFDMWGLGHSPGTRGLIDVGQAIDDHLAARRQLRDQSLPIFFVAHSLGGLVTASSVIRDQSDVSGVVLMSAALDYDTTPALRAVANVLAFLAPTVYAPLEPSPTSDLYRGADRDTIIAKVPLIYQGQVPLLMAAGTANVSSDNFALYPAWEVPVLILHGTADKLINTQASQRFYDTITASDKTLHILDGAYHELLNDTDREQTLALILSWLDERIAAN